MDRNILTIKNEVLIIKRLLLLLLSIALVGCGGGKDDNITGNEDFTQYVNPFIGTAYTGHTYPAATTPFGMVQVGPDNGIKDWEFCSGYHDKSASIIGFSHTHLSGTGCPDMGDIMLMPFVGNDVFTAGDESDTSTGYRSKFSQANEVASPGYYSVKLDDYNIAAEMTATPRVGFHRYTFPASDNVGIIIDLEHGIGDKTDSSYLKVVDDRTIVGKRHSTGFVKDHQYYFCARFSKPFKSVKSFDDGSISENRNIKGKITKMILRFETKAEEQILAKVALSTASEEGAAKNLDAELPDWNFEDVKAQAATLWNEYLKRVEIKAMNDDEKISFYTSLYHSLLMPNLVTDVDGSYSGWDHQLHKSEDGDMYTNFSLWDTYRAEHPFLNLLYPDVNAKLVRSLLEKHRQTGLLVTNEYGLCETWCMIGNHAVPVIVDAYLKGVKDASYNAEFAYEAVKHAMTFDHNKSDWSVYDKYGYFPYDNSYIESVSRTMEAVYDDYCAAQMAKALCKNDDYQFFMNRTNNYKNLFDKNTMFVRPRDASGRWREPFDSHKLGTKDYTEGNGWQWTWHVQHDIEGLISLFPSHEVFANKLDSLFFVDLNDAAGLIKAVDVTGLIGLYAHGNEPSHHITYLYTLSGSPDKTAKLVREVFDKFYLAKRDGLCGNDDCGQMSAWYMFSAFGFYPVAPVSGEYIFGAPQLHEAVLHLVNGKNFTIKVNNLSDANKYVKSIHLNGVEIPYKSVKYDDIINGGTLEYEMKSE